MTENSNYRPVGRQSDDPRVLAAAAALREHFASEDAMVSGFPLDEYVCCAKVALEAADGVGG